MIDRRLLLAGAGAATLSACAEPFDTAGGRKKPQGGIGGTGIVGTLTDFGSVLVNGLRLEVSADTLITNAFGLARERDLAIGQQLTIEAADGRARRIHIAYPVIGTVAEGATRDEGVVAGVPVTLETGALGALIPGARVAVSGVWRGPRVVASRIDILPGPGPDVIACEYMNKGPEGVPAIGGRRLASLPGSAPANLSYVTATGKNTDDGFVVQHLREGRFTGAAGPLVELSVEGYLRPDPNPPFRSVSGLGHSFHEGSRLAWFKENRVLFSGGYEGTFVAEEGLLLPEQFAARRTLLADVLAGKDVGERLAAR